MHFYHLASPSFYIYILIVILSYTVDHEIFIVKIFSCSVRRPIPILVAKDWRQKLDYAKKFNLQVKYFTGENILIYGSSKSKYCIIRNRIG